MKVGLKLHGKLNWITNIHTNVGISIKHMSLIQLVSSPIGWEHGTKPPLVLPVLSTVANFDPSTFSVMHCEFCSAGFDTRAGLSSHARAHLRDFGITNWDVTISPIHILRELFLSRPDLVIPTDPPRSSGSSQEEEEEEEGDEEEERELGEGIVMVKLEEETESERMLRDSLPSGSPKRCKKEDGEEESEGEFSLLIRP